MNDEELSIGICEVCGVQPITVRTLKCANGKRYCIRCFGLAQRLLGNDVGLEIPLTVLCPVEELIFREENGENNRSER